MNNTSKLFISMLVMLAFIGSASAYSVNLYVSSGQGSTADLYINSGYINSATITTPVSTTASTGNTYSVSSAAQSGYYLYKYCFDSACNSEHLVTAPWDLPSGTISGNLNIYMFFASTNMNLLGASLSWDKSEYNKGDIAHLTMTYNASQMNNNMYLYQVIITNPVTYESSVFTLTQASNSFSQTMVDEGVWEATIWISLKSDPDQAIYYIHDYKTVSGASVISFITWQYHSLDLGALGSDGKFTYGVSSSMSDYITTYLIKMYKDGVLVNTWDDVPNFGTMYYPLTDAGRYEVKLIKSVAYIETVLKTDTTIVKAPQSFIRASKTSYNTTESVIISGNKYPESTEKNFYYVIVSHYQSISSVSQRKEMSFPPYSFNEQYTLPVGRYTASLYGYSNQCGVEGDSVCMREKDYVTFDVVEPMVGNQHALNISWVKKEEKLWTVAWVNYQNATSNDIVKIFDNAGKEFKNWRTATYPYTLGVQLPQEPSYIGNWSAKIYNASNLNDFKVSYLNVVSASQQNFTNDEGVVMNWDTPAGTPGMHELTWNTGTYSGSYYIKLVNGVTGVYLQQFPYTTGTAKAQHQSIYLDKDIKIYTAQFISSNSTILSSANIEIGENVGINPTQPINGNGNIPPIEGLSPAANSLANTLSMTALYGLIIWIGIVWSAAKIGINGLPLIGVLWMAGIFVALIGMFDPYKIYVIALSTIVAAVLFRAGQNATTTAD